MRTLMERRRIFPENFPHRTPRQETRKIAATSSKPTTSGISSLFSAPLHAIEGLYHSVASTISPTAPAVDAKQAPTSSNAVSATKEPSAGAVKTTTVVLTDPYLGLPAPTDEADKFFLSQFRAMMEDREKARKAFVRTDELDKQFAQDKRDEREERRQEKKELEMKRLQRQKAREESFQRQRAARHRAEAEKEARYALEHSVRLEMLRERKARQQQSRQDAARKFTEQSTREEEQEIRAEFEADRIQRIFGYYDRRWQVILSMPYFDLFSFDNFPWPCLVDVNSVEELTAGKVFAFIFHPHRPFAGAAGIDYKITLDKELKKWDPDTFEDVVLPSFRDCPEELVAEVRRGYRRVYHHLKTFA